MRNCGSAKRIRFGKEYRAAPEAAGYMEDHMCTAAAFVTKDFYFGRTLDYEMSYGEEAVIVPRNFRIAFPNIEKKISMHPAYIGMAHVDDNYPLMYEGMSEKGLAIAALNFVGYAKYSSPMPDKFNLAPHEVVPFVLCQCSTVKQATELLGRCNIINSAYKDYPVGELHWIISDKDGTATLECTAAGMNIYDNCAGLLTNNPEYPQQMSHLNNYMNLSNKEPKNNFCSALPLKAYSHGMGAIGLPGDLSSESRFVRAAFVKSNSVCGDSENESVNQFFHILGSVEQQKGCCDLGDGRYQYTYYTSCCNCSKGLYYYTTYDNHQISAIDMHRANLNSDKLIRYTLRTAEQIFRQN